VKRVELSAVVHLSVEEIPGATAVLGHGEETMPATRVATIEDVEMDDPGFQQKLKQFREIGSLQFVTDLSPGRHRGRLSIVFEVAPETF